MEGYKPLYGYEAVALINNIIINGLILLALINIQQEKGGNRAGEFR